VRKRISNRRDVPSTIQMIKVTTISNVKSVYQYNHHSLPRIKQTSDWTTNNRTFLKRTNEIVGRNHDTKDRVILYYFANLDHIFYF